MPLVANFANFCIFCKNNERLLKPWHMGTHLRVLSESHPMNTNMRGFSWFSKTLCSCAWRKVASALEGLKILVETGLKLFVIVATCK